jgi:DNA-binding IclR family transcriptional regulator
LSEAATAASPDVDEVKSPTYPIGSVDSALRLLLMIRETDRLRVADAARALGVGRSTAHRLLAMLQYHGFVRQNPESRAYLPGPTLIEIGLAAVRDIDIRESTLPYLEQVRDALGETAHLSVLRGRDAFFLNSVESDRAVRTGGRIGALLPAHCTAAGKVLLAYLTPREIRARYPSPKLQSLTGRSVVSRDELERQLEEVRVAGYATNFGESESDLAAIAAPIFAAQGKAIASLSVSAPLTRLSREDAEVAAATLVAIADEASRTISGFETSHDRSGS